MKQLVMWCNHGGVHEWGKRHNFFYLVFISCKRTSFNDISQKHCYFFICKTFLMKITLRSKPLITLTAFFTVLMVMGKRDAGFFSLQYGQAYIFFCSCLKGWLQALGVGSSSLMVFQWVFVRSDCAPPGGLRSSPRVIYYLSPPPAALWLRGRCQQRREGGDDCKGVLYIRQDSGHRHTLREYGEIKLLTCITLRNRFNNRQTNRKIQHFTGRSF